MLLLVGSTRLLIFSAPSITLYEFEFKRRIGGVSPATSQDQEDICTSTLVGYENVFFALRS
jgi:hypothetical protein